MHVARVVDLFHDALERTRPAGGAPQDVRSPPLTAERNPGRLQDEHGGLARDSATKPAFASTRTKATAFPIT